MAEPLECRGVELYGLATDLADAGVSFHLEVRGWSMYPIIRDGDKISVFPATIDDISVGDVAFFRSGDRLLAHRVVGRITDAGSISLQARGDRFRQEDPPFGQAELVGRVVTVVRNHRGNRRVIQLDRGFSRAVGFLITHSRAAHHCYRWGAHSMHRLENLMAKMLSFSGH